MGIALITADHIETLASRLAASLLNERRDPFNAPRVLVPNFSIKQWLTLRLAKWAPQPGAKGIAINIAIQFFEAGLWEMLLLLDPELSNGNKNPPLRLTREFRQWMIISTLLAEAHGGQSGPIGDFAPLLDYLQIPPSAEDEKTGTSWNRRLWQLADKLARLFHDYEQDRPEIIKEWLDAPAPKKAPPMARCQRALYRRLFASGGLQDRLAQQTGRMSLSLPQYFRRLFCEAAAPKGPLPALQVFMLPQLSPVQAEIFKALGGLGEITLYDFAPAPKAGGLRKQWGHAEQARQALLGKISAAVADKDKSAPNAGAVSVLARLQEHLRGRPAKSSPTSKTARSSLAPDQDRSLQILACPSLRREVENAYNSIIANMLEQNQPAIPAPRLKLSDIAILVPDMPAYKPVLESVFARAPGLLTYNLLDSTAAEDSVYAQAAEALLALGEDGFTRREVFKLVLNPCFLARLGLAREEAEIWLRWADRLNIYRGFKAAAEGVFTWDHALRRMRLGRIMEAPSDAALTGRFPDYHGVAPYADMDSQESFEVGRFSETVEALAEAAERLNRSHDDGQPRSCSRWAELLLEYLDRFLEIPPDRPEEQAVRAALRAALEEFGPWDAVTELSGPAGRNDAAPHLNLRLLREFVHGNLSGIASRKGHHLLDGVTISALRPGRAVPFKIIYVLGLGAGKFPGEENRSTLDLETKPASAQDLGRQAFCETILAARQKLYLSYVSQDLQKQVEFQPCTLVNELRGYVERNILSGPGAPLVEFKTAAIPLNAGSRKYIEKQHREPWTDMPAGNYSRHDDLLALSGHLAELERAGKKGRAYITQIQNQRRELAENFAPPALSQDRRTPLDEGAPERVELRELEGFLLNPAEAALKRRFKFFDEEDADLSLAEDEPFASTHPFDFEIIKAVETYCVATQTGQTKLETVQGAALDFLAAYYEDAYRRGKSPAGPFKTLDRNGLSKITENILSPPDAKETGLAAWLGRCVGPAWQIIIGEPRYMPSGPTAQRKFLPPLKLTLGGSGACPSLAELHGEFSYLARNRQDGCMEFLVLAGTAGKDKNEVGRHVLPAFLCYLSLRALRRGLLAGDAGPAWRVLVLYKDGSKSWNYEHISQEAAEHYLAGLVNDYLAPDRADMLPFEIIRADKFLRQACLPNADAGGPELWKQYASCLSDAVKEDGEGSFRKYRRPEFLDLIQAQVPENAYQLVQTRLSPLLNYKELA